MAPIEYVSDLIEELPTSGDDKPIYARTPHGSYYFLLDGIEHVEHEGEDVCVVVLREVEW